MSSKAHCPQPWGQRVGGVSGGADAGSEEERSSGAPESQRSKAPWFAGYRQPSRAGGETRVLAGPSRLQGARSQAGKRTGDNRCPLEE
jgi:hypothetical protein